MSLFSFHSIPFNKTPFAAADTTYAILDYREAADRYSVYKEDSPQEVCKTFRLHHQGNDSLQSVRFGKAVDRHMLHLENSYVVETVGVFTSDGCFLPWQFTSLFNHHRALVKAGKVKMERGWWNQLSTARARVLRGDLFYGDSNYQGYGHFLLEALPRCWALPKLGQDKVAVLSGFKRRVRLYGQCLPALGYSAGNIKKFDKIVYCKHLYVASQPSGIKRYVTPEAMEVWRAVGRQYSVAHADTPKKIFISRAKVERRGLKNQCELEAIFKSKGFYVCHPEIMKFSDQVRLFANATHIAGPYGSAIFNALFAQHPAALLVFCSDTDFFSHFPCFAEQFTLDAFLAEQPQSDDGISPYERDWEIRDMDYCTAVIEQWLAENR